MFSLTREQGFKKSTCFFFLITIDFKNRSPWVSASKASQSKGQTQGWCWTGNFSRGSEDTKTGLFGWKVALGMRISLLSWSLHSSSFALKTAKPTQLSVSTQASGKGNSGSHRTLRVTCIYTMFLISGDCKYMFSSKHPHMMKRDCADQSQACG